MQKFKLLAALLSACAMQASFAAESASGATGSEGGSASPFSANVMLVSNYLYRGIAQTGGKPALQGGFDYEHHSGFYAGVFGSNSSFFSNLYIERAGAEGAYNASLELDTYVGFKNQIADDYNYDVGFLRYNFPGNYAPGATTGDTNELYFGFGYKWISAKYSYSLGNTFGVKDAAGTSYIEVNAKAPVAEGLTVGVHAGKQTYKGVTADALTAAGANPSYTDYKLSVTKEINSYEIGLEYTKTNAATGPGSFYYVLNKDLGAAAVALTLARSF